MTTDLISRVLARHASDCAAHHHIYCAETLDCEEALAAHLRSQGKEQAGDSFDASRALLDRAGMWPDETWPTAALLRLVKDRLLELPGRGELRRRLMVTTALARLGERGVPVDAIVRTCLSTQLIRRMIIRMAVLWVDCRNNETDRSRLTPRYEAWLRLLDDDPQLVGRTDIPVQDAVASALRGTTGEVVKRWVDSASVEDILAWRIDRTTKVEVYEGDRILCAGEAAAKWIVDRFTETYLDDWSRTSLEWEMVYRHDPTATVSRVGLPAPLLDERSVALDEVIDALARRLTGSIGGDPIVDGLGTSEIIEVLVELLKEERFDDAVVLAQRAAHVAPENMPIAVALGCCLLPTNPTRAAEVLDRAAGAPVHLDTVVAIDRATICLVTGDIDGFGKWFSTVRDSSVEDGFFWDPVDLVLGSAHLRGYTFAAWRQRAQEAAALIKRPTDA